MSGTIIRANWDNGQHTQHFVAVTPLGDEIILYTTDADTISPTVSRGGFDNISCSTYSQFQHGFTAVGQINGTVGVLDMTDNSSTVIRLRPKQSRPCNAVSFSHSLVAAAFDKGRQDTSLQIWSLDSESRQMPVHSYVPNEAVLSALFYPDRPDHLLCGSYKYLREFDIRAEVPAFQLAAKCTLDLAVDPFQPHNFSSSGEDGSLALWDRRMLTRKNRESPVLQFNKLLDTSRKNARPCLRYSPVRRGEFSSIFNGELIRRWHTGVVPATDDASATATTPVISSSAGAAVGATAALKAQSAQLYRPDHDSLFVSLVLDVKADYSRVISFDYSPDARAATSTSFVCMRQSGSVFRMPAVECIESLDFNSNNEFSIVGPEGAFTRFLDEPAPGPPSRANDLSLSADLNRFREENTPPVVDGDENTEIDDENTDNIENGHDLNDHAAVWNMLGTSDMLRNDICWTIRRRAVLGYSHDCELNIRVLESIDDIDNQLALRNTWKWLSLAKKSLDKGTMVSHGVDLGFLGVIGIWNGIEKLTNPKRFNTDGPLSEQFFAQTIKAIVSSKGKKAAAIHIPSASEHKAQRKLCLIVSGWYFSDEEFDERLEILVSLGFYEKAAGWAVFHGHIDRAVSILSSSPKERLRIIATAVAAYLAYRDSNVNSPWKDQCRKMASELDNPYLRAIFAFIADNDWWDVLDEHSLPLRERLGVALRFLSDKDLTVYLHRLADYVVTKGELEGLMLTGITGRGVDLLQSYVDRTSDVQTAALMASFGSPRYLVDRRIDHWIDSYRGLLNSWSLFKTRATFDVHRTRLSRTSTGVPTLSAVPKQN
ncbi:hypothetical protein PSN45_003789 [Yamadazyma tenuis]|uniref:uncharacterized protein n=1 Tax=Candida tenuis TaxID=2315449 RepID=UPI00279D5D3A|nr:hypothetical protein PSN45_003789 [Yamadazyma tenuis]